MRRLLFITMILAAFTSQVFAVLNDGMIARWSFDDADGTVANDSEDYLKGDFDVEISNGGWDIGILGGAATGSGNFIGTIGPIPALAGAEKFSFACWVNPNRSTCDGWAALFSQSVGADPYIFAGINSNASAPGGYLDWDIRICGRSVRSNEGTNKAAKLIDNQWNLLVFMFDYTLGNVPEALTIWINGYKVQGAETTANADGLVGTYYTFATPPSNYEYHLGQDRNSTNRRFGGLLDETALWTRVLTDQEIAEMWNDGEGRVFKPFGQAHTPDPDGTELVFSDQVSSVSWSGGGADDPNFTITGYDVYFSDIDDDFTGESPESPIGSQGTSTVYTPASIDFDTTYYWKVDTHAAISDSNDVVSDVVVEGRTWQFTTFPENIAPEVDAGKKVITSMDLLPALLLTAGTADYNDDVESVSWQVTASPDGSNPVVSSTNSDLAAPTAELDTDIAGTYEITLTATDSLPQSSSDTVEVVVTETDCQAAQLLPDWPGFNHYDRDNDCDVDGEDMRVFAVSWLEDQNVNDVYLIPQP